MQCDVDGDIEYEFPCYNYTEALEGLWSSEDARYTEGGVYGGVLLKTAASIPFSNTNPSIGNVYSIDINNEVKNLNGSKYKYKSKTNVNITDLNLSNLPF